MICTAYTSGSARVNGVGTEGWLIAEGYNANLAVVTANAHPRGRTRQGGGYRDGVAVMLCTRRDNPSARRPAIVAQR